MRLRSQDLRAVSGHSGSFDDIFCISKIKTTKDGADRGHEDVRDEGANDCSERRAHNETDGHVDEIAFHGKVFEF